MRRLLLLALLLAGCDDQDAPGYPAYDLWQNRYPPECMRDLNEVRVPISLVDQATLVRLAGARVSPDREVLGWYSYPSTGHPAHIYIWERLRGKELNEAIRHERCHFLAGEWHD